ncbi:MAG TPA: HesA/MoeB/ThiF family protein [Acidiferrobacter sp.]|nr:HesA/MoeB/ThiF family protein [Acidiferrobacter sp.]
MDDNALLYHSAHIFLPEMGIAGVERLAAAHVLLVGLGGLGSVVALYLARSGIGELTLVDHDTVSRSNLPRQILYDQSGVGILKTEVARHALMPVASGHIRLLPERLEGTRLQEEVARADIVCDASDNFATRFALNAACVAHRRPLVSAAVIRLEGQILVVDPAQPEAGCYRCLYPETEELAENCSERGVLAPVAGIMGAMQATEAIKMLVGIGEPLARELLLFDAKNMTSYKIRRRQDPCCPVCAPDNAC